MIIKVNNCELRIRRCTDEDYWFVYNLLKRNMSYFYMKYWGGWNSKKFRNNFNKKNIKIIEYKNKRIAYYTLRFKNNYSYVDDIQISTLMRGKGIGTYLIYLMETETKKHNFKKIRLKVFKDNKARALYSKLGYQQIVDEGSTIIMQKKLSL